MDARSAKDNAPTIEGNMCAASLVGLDREAALDRAKRLGFITEELPSTVEFVNCDLHPNRIRLFVDADERIVAAWAG